MDDLFAIPRRKNIAAPMRRPRMAAAPMAIPASAPGDRLVDGTAFDDDEPAESAKVLAGAAVLVVNVSADVIVIDDACDEACEVGIAEVEGVDVGGDELGDVDIANRDRSRCW